MAGNRKRTNRDEAAGDLLKALRQERGLSRRELLVELYSDGRFKKDAIPSLKTLWNIEEDGVIPRERYRFTLAAFYGVGVRKIWGPHEQRLRISDLEPVLAVA